MPHEPGWIDLHCHVLPGVDDGAADLKESLAMCRRAAADGCRDLVATPHLRHAQWENADRGALEALCESLQAHLADEVELHLGGEIAVHSESVEELYELPGGNLLTLAGSRYLLLELDWHGFGPDILELVHELRLRGFWPIIAHPERVPHLAANPDLFEALVRRGAYLQLTAMSLVGDLGPRLQGLSEELLEADLIHFVASDAHDLEFRPPGLRRAYERVVGLCGDARARRIFLTYPRAVLEDLPLADSEPLTDLRRA